MLIVIASFYSAVRMLSTTSLLRSDAKLPTEDSEIDPLVNPTLAEAEVKADRAVAVDAAAAEVEEAAQDKGLHIPEPIVEAVAPVVAAVESAVESVREVYEDAVKSPQLVAEEEGRTVFVGGLSWNLDNDWLKEEVEKTLEVSEGVVNVRIARDHMGRSKGCVDIILAIPELKLDIVAQIRIRRVRYSRTSSSRYANRRRD